MQAVEPTVVESYPNLYWSATTEARRRATESNMQVNSASRIRHIGERRMASSQSRPSNATLDACLQEVTGRITTLAGREVPLRFHESGMGLLRTVATPMQRRASRTGYSFSRGSREHCLAIWDHIWHHSNLMEVKHQALYAYQRKTLTRREVRKRITKAP
jgi:hypothetical protein